MLDIAIALLLAVGSLGLLHHYSWPNRSLRRKFCDRNRMRRRDIEPDPATRITQR